VKPYDSMVKTTARRLFVTDVFGKQNGLSDHVLSRLHAADIDHENNQVK
jgi:hypothetical protein